MALAMDMELDSGVTVTYWKVFIDGVDTKNERVNVKLSGSVASGKAALVDYSYCLDNTQVTFVDKMPTMASIYAYIKTINDSQTGTAFYPWVDWTGATDA